MREGHRTGLAFMRQMPTAPASSYWVGRSRPELRQAIADRRAQQRIPTESEMQCDPSLSATAALYQDHKWRPVSGDVVGQADRRQRNRRQT